jgi:hypothetical protein
MPVNILANTIYDGSVLPQNSPEPWVEDKSAGAVVSTDGNILTVTTTGGEKASYTREVGNLIPANDKRLTWIGTVVSQTGTGEFPSQQLQMGDGVRRFAIFLETNEITLRDGTATPQVLFTGDMTIERTVLMEFDDSSGARLTVDGNLEATIIYTNLVTSGANSVQFGDPSGVSTEHDSSILYNSLEYTLDFGADGWVGDGDLFSKEFTVANTYLVDDSHLFKPKPLNLTQKESWDIANFVRLDRIDDNTIKMYVVEPNTEAFDFEFVIIKDKASIT